MTEIETLREKSRQIHALDAAIALIEWDTAVCMPKAGAESREEITRILVEKRVDAASDPSLGDSARAVAADPESSQADLDLARLVLEDHELTVRVPKRLAVALQSASERGDRAWQTAFAEKDFSVARGELEQLVSLNREWASAVSRGGDSSPYEPCLRCYGTDASVQTLESFFSALKSGLLSVFSDAEAWQDREKIPTRAEVCRGGAWSKADSIAFARGVLADVGLDSDAFRIDETCHPMEFYVGPGDARISIASGPTDPLTVLYDALHEAGHALYDLGHGCQCHGTHLDDVSCMALHESQSRFWENVVGKSFAFWKRYAPACSERFDSSLSDASPMTLFRTVNRSAKTPIRTDADEVTYGLHVAFRFELERAMIEGELAVADLPDAWAAAVESTLGIADDAVGCLQDPHWFSGDFGYFPSYAIGDCLAASLYFRAREDLGPLARLVSVGEFAPILEWMRGHVHRRGAGLRLSDVWDGTPSDFLRRLVCRHVDDENDDSF